MISDPNGPVASHSLSTQSPPQAQPVRVHVRRVSNLASQDVGPYAEEVIMRVAVQCKLPHNAWEFRLFGMAHESRAAASAACAAHRSGVVAGTSGRHCVRTKRAPATGIVQVRLTQATPTANPPDSTMCWLRHRYLVPACARAIRFRSCSCTGARDPMGGSGTALLCEF